MSESNGDADPGIRSLLDKVVKSEGVRNARFEISKATVKGDGYLGIIHAAKIIGDDKVLSVIVKTAPKNEQMRKQAELVQIYFHETYFYDTIYPAYIKLQMERGVDRPFANIAKCYATSMEEFNEGLVLENLLDQGYQMWNRRNPMNAEHIAFILKEYGRFHAVGFALKDQEGELYAEITEKLVDIFGKYADNQDNVAIIENQLNKSLDVLDPEKDKVAHDRLDKFFKNMKEFQDILKTANMDEYSVITHGDCWCNNMMFKYEDPRNPTEPISIRTLDWQIIRVASPVQDITHVFYTSAPKEILDDYKTYMRIYYDSFSSHLKKLGSDPEKLYPISVLEAHWKKFCPNGLFVAMFMIKIMLSEKDEVPDLSETTAGSSIMEAFDYVPKNSDYKQRMRDIIYHFVNNDFI